MAEDFAIGKELEIPKSVLDNIEKIDKMINDISKDSELMAQHFGSAMIRMGNGAETLLKKLQQVHQIVSGLNNLNIKGLSDISNGMNKTVTDSEKMANSLSKAAAAINKSKKVDDVFNPQNSVLAWQGLQKNIAQIQERQEKLTTITKEYESTLKSIKSGKGGVLTKDMQDSYKAAQKELEANKQIIESYKQKQQAIIAYQREQKKEAQNAEALRSIATGGSLNEQRQIDAMKRMNDYYRELERTSASAEKKRQEEAKKSAREVEKATQKEQREREKSAKSAERQQKAEERLRKSQEQRANNNAINAYNRAMASSEALITQRINKIAKLRQAEEMLLKTSKDYSANISKIRSEIERLNKLNQGQVDAYGRIIKSQHNLMNTSDQLMRKIALIFSVSQIQGYLMNLVKVRGEFELQNTALASILQNKDKADKLFAQITELAVKSPFTLKELTTYTKSLSAYQVEYEKLYDTTKMLADVSAGLGVDMQRLILAFGQVKAANVLRGTEVRQFTEAGLNILGELAKYYSDLEDKMITVGEVQDRVTKKMVDFGDVEEVFKRVTSAGGIFYNMQERQAETLAGQMSNLQDSIDIMLNDIGKANDGIIKNIVASVRTIVENWEIFANIINASSVGFVVYTAKTLLAAKANGVFASSAIAATAAQSGLVGATAKTINMFNSFIAFAKANPFVMIASAVAYLGYELYDHVKKVEENKKAYDVLVNSVKEAEKGFGSVVSKIEEQNEKIKKTLNTLNTLQEGTKEYYEVEGKANKEREKLNSLLEELRNNYPEVYSGIVKQKDGTVDLAAAQKELNAELQRTTYLSYLSRQTETFWDDGLIENIKNASEEQQNYKSKIDDVSNGFIQMNAKIKEYFATNKYASKDLQKELDGIAKSSMSTYDKIQKMYDVVRNTTGINIGDLRDIIYEYQDEARKAEKANNALNESNNKLAENIKQIAEGYKSAFNTSTEEGMKSAKRATEEFLRLLDIKDEAVRKFVQTQFEITIGVKIDTKGQAEKQFSEMEKRINEYLKSNQFSFVPKVEAGEGTVKYFNDLKNEYKDLSEEAEKIKRANQGLYPDKTNAQRLEEVNRKMVQVKKTLEDWGELEEKRSKASKDNPELQRLKEQISLIKKAGDEYKKLRKYYGDTDATAQIRESFADAFDNLGLDVSMSFDTEGIVDGIRNLQYETIKGGKEVVDKTLAELESSKQIEVKAKGLEEIQRQIDDIFSNYEFNLELQSAGIDTGAFKDMLQDLGATDEEISMVGLDASTFEEVAEKVRGIISDLQKQGGDEQLKQARKFQEQLTALEVKEARKRFDELAKLREKYQTNQEKMQTVQTNLFADKDALALLEEQKAMGKEVNKEQEELLKLRIQAGEDALLQLRSEALQLTDFWQRLFSDLNDISVNSLLELSRITDEIIANKSEIKGDKGELKGYSSSYTDKDGMTKQVTLTKQQYQQLLKQNNQVADEIQRKNPFRALYEAVIKGKQEGETQLDYYTRLESIVGDVSNAAFEAAGNLMDIFGANDDAKEMLNSIKGIADGTVNLGMGVARITSGDIIGGGLSAIKGIAGIVTNIFAIGDKKKEREIQRQVELVNELERSYEKLEKAIDSAFSIDTLKKSTDQAIANLKAQNDALEAARAAEIDKKKTDDARVKEFESQIADNLDRIAELEQDKISKVTAGILDDGLSAADAFVDAWLEAFQETGDGLKGLEDNFNEMLLNFVKRQAAMTLVAPLIENMQKELEKYINKDDTELTISEADRFAEYIREQLPELSESLENMFESLKDVGLDFSQSGDTMSGLSKSISGITEETADALAAITESIRYFSADSNAVLKQIYNAIAMPNVENPFLMELRQQTSLLTSINSLFSSVIKTSAGKGKVIRMEIA